MAEATKPLQWTTSRTRPRSPYRSYLTADSDTSSYCGLTTVTEENDDTDLLTVIQSPARMPTSANTVTAAIKCNNTDDTVTTRNLEAIALNHTPRRHLSVADLTSSPLPSRSPYTPSKINMKDAIDDIPTHHPLPRTPSERFELAKLKAEASAAARQKSEKRERKEAELEEKQKMDKLKRDKMVDELTTKAKNMDRQ
jgi:hypothetical protein